MTSNAVPKTSRAMNNPITALKKTFKIKTVSFIVAVSYIVRKRSVILYASGQLYCTQAVSYIVRKRSVLLMCPALGHVLIVEG
jgi:hypothetical protein